MSKNLVVIGFGPGNATAVAEKFGAEGFSVGLVGRDEDRLAAGVSTLKARGIAATHSRPTPQTPPRFVARLTVYEPNWGRSP